MFKIIVSLSLLTLLSLQATPLLKTGQTQSYDVDGKVVTDGSVKDDGYYKAGATRSYSRSVVDVVTDNVTGLEWQDDVDSVEKPWVTQENYDAGNYNDTSGDTATTYCSLLGLDGGGWRLPSVEELETLVDDGKYPTVAEGIFQHISSSNYWSSTTYANDSNGAWDVNFYYGYSDGNFKKNSNYVRCVRGGQLDNLNFSRDNITEIVTESRTNLQWQDNEDVNTTQRTWQGAIDYCENTLSLGGHNDWRLPNKKELLSIADRSRYNPAIDNTIFVNTASPDYWSSTAFVDSTYDAWYVGFGNGGSDYGSKGDNGYVRCVRGGQFDNFEQKITPIIMYLLN